MAGGASLSAVAERPVIAEQPAALAEFDFTALHRQASDALAELRQSQERRLALGRNSGLLSALDPAFRRIGPPYFAIAFWHASHTLAGVAGMSM